MIGSWWRSGSGRSGARRGGRLLAATACVCAVAGAGAASAQAACTSTWTGASSNSWGDAGNWNPKIIPGINGNTADVCLPAGAAHYPVVYAPFVALVPNVGDRTFAQVEIDSLTVGGSGAGLIVHGAATQTGPSAGGAQTQLRIDDGGSVAAGGLLELLATDDGNDGGSEPRNNGGHANVFGGGTIVNSGAFVSASTSTQDADQAHQNELGSTLRNAPGSTGTVQSGTLLVDLANNITNQSTWTTDPAGRMLLTYNGFNQSHSTPTSFTNDGSYVNNGVTVVNQADHGGVGNESGSPLVWTQQGGSVTGSPVQLTDGAELADTAAGGPGAFLFDSHEGQLSGTIPAGQTITVESDLYGSDAFLNDVTLLGDQVINQGAIVLHAPNVSSDTTTANVLTGSQLVNQGTISATSDVPSLTNELDVSLANSPGATVDVASGTLSVTNGQTVTNDGTIAIASGSTLSTYANQFLTGPETFTNAADGTIAPQVAADGVYGTLQLGSDLHVNLGGTVAPQLIGGYVPAIGTSFTEFPLAMANPRPVLTGTFAAVTAGFSADYSHASGDSASGIALVYGAPSSPAPTSPTPTPNPVPVPVPASSAFSVHKPSVKGARVRVTLSCSAGGGCAKATITARRGHVVVARSSATLAGGGTKTVTLALNAKGRKLLAHDHRLKLTVTVTAHGVSKRYTATVGTSKRKKG